MHWVLMCLSFTIRIGYYRMDMVQNVKKKLHDNAFTNVDLVNQIIYNFLIYNVPNESIRALVKLFTYNIVNNQS